MILKNKLILIGSIIFLSLSSMTGCNSKNNESNTVQKPQTREGYENIDAKATEKLVENTTDILVVDVRSDDEYDRGHLINAINLPYDDEFNSELMEITDYKDKTILVYCQTGNRSEKAAKELVDNGFKTVKNATKGVGEYEYTLDKVDNITGKEAEEIINDAKHDKVDYEDDYDGNDDLVIIDVRNQKEFNNGHIENAINIPFETIDNKIGELDKYKNNEIIVYSATGNKSEKISEMLLNKGFRDVSNVVDGVSEYNYNLVK